MPAQPRILWIDFCRVYAAFFVIVRHTERYGGSINFFADLFNYRSLIFFFFLMAGYFTHRMREGQWIDFRRIGHLLWPFLFWAVVATLLLVPLLNREALAAGDFSFISWSVLQDECGLKRWVYYSFSNVPLWFLRTLLIITLFSGLLQRIPSRVMVPLILIIFAASDVLCHADAECAEKQYRTDGVEWLPYRLYESVLAAGFYCLGLLLRRHADPARLTEWLSEYAWVPVVGSLVLLPIVYHTHFSPPIMSSALVLLGTATIMSIGCLCQRYLPRFCRFVAAWGPAAFFVYVTHYILLKFFMVALTGNYRGVITRTEALWVPFAILLISLGLFVLLRRLFPNFMRVIALTGDKPGKS